MKLSGLVETRVRGFRVMDLTALVVLLALALTVYAFKTFAGRERSDIADIESQIKDESRRVRLLNAEVAHLESPGRLERLSAAYANQAPVTARQEVPPEALPQVAGRATHP
ncbi:MAG: cell division protein [Caulobacterales bacterium]